ncbi:sensor histidine kinase [Subtercola sp. RTI3]|uniref:sensor histidine kinase n=1 Tax=Subtercola sp. RTI3 TaxID=3048639 RepID=UPI002B22ED45|nr:histidine kinase [Subtercola sp. RTI3]MEA9985573.1 histidine kinase [Subtercola sp. RTI3]
MSHTTRLSPLSLGLNLLGVAVVTFYLLTSFTPVIDLWLSAVALIGIAAWIAEIVLATLNQHADRRIRALALWLTATCGALVAAPTLGLGCTLIVVGVLRAIANLEWPLWRAVTLTLVTAVIVPIGALLATLPPLALVAIECSVALAALGGINRRQFRRADAQARALLDERLAIREEQARVQVLADRQAVARDIHDVLAHSLGGLVLQLDAVEALLESGHLDDALRRVHDARLLAASGLADARRAVDALRAHPENTTALTLPLTEVLSSIVTLVESHRSLGGAVTEHLPQITATHAVSVSPDAAAALTRAVQEGLTNARKHAPGSTIHLVVRLAAGSLTPTVEVALSTALEPGIISAPAAPSAPGRTTEPALITAAPLIASLQQSGGQHGLAGMRERFEALPGASLSAGVQNGHFVVAAIVPARTVAEPA